MHTLNCDDNRDNNNEDHSLQQLLPQLSIKGMINPNHTSCYINSTISLLCYTIQPVVIQFLQEYHRYKEFLPTAYRANTTDDTTATTTLNELEQEYVQLLCNIMYNDGNNNKTTVANHNNNKKVINPRHFYALLLSSSTFRHNVHPTSGGGDAVSTFIYLVQLLVAISNKMYNSVDHTTNEKYSEKEANDDTKSTKHQCHHTYTPESTRVQDTCNSLLYSGSMYTSITEYISTTTTTRKETGIKFIRNRTKQLKTRLLWNPLTVPITKSIPMNEFIDTKKNNKNDGDVVSHLQRTTINSTIDNRNADLSTTNVVVSSLQEAFYNLLCTDQVIRGNYHWKSSSETNTIDSNTGIINSKNISNDVADDSDDSKLTTEKVYCKKYHVQQFPPVLTIHLQRFAIHSGITYIPQPIEDSTSHIKIPEMINVISYIENKSSTKVTIENVIGNVNIDDNTDSTSLEQQSRYQLVGGILHIHDYGTTSDDDVNDETTDNHPVIGHYVSVIRQRQVHDNNIGNDKWCLIDDEIVSTVSIEQVLTWLGGGWYQNPIFKNNESCEDRNERLHARGILLVYHHLDMSLNVIIPTSNETTSVPESFDNTTFQQREHSMEDIEQKMSTWSDEHEQDATLMSIPTTTTLQHGQYVPKTMHKPKPKSCWLDDDDSDSD